MTLLALVTTLLAITVMLGTRTKQVFSYGRRGQRIINISEDRENFQSNTKDKDKDTELWRNTTTTTPVVLKTKMRQHFPSSGSPSPQQITRMRKNNRKKLLSPSLSPAPLKKNNRTVVRQISKSKQKATTSARPPLISYHPNVPGTPAAAAAAASKTNKKKSARVPGSKGTPMNPKLLLGAKPFSPFIDVDIIVLDAMGRRVSQERRVSRTDVVVNPSLPAKVGVKTVQKKRRGLCISDSDSDGEDDVAPKPPKRGGGRVKTVVISSDESEEEDEPPSIPINRSQAKSSKSSRNTSRPRMAVEVVIPPFQYPAKVKVKAITKLDALPLPSATADTPLSERQPSRPARPSGPPTAHPYPQAQELTPVRLGRSKSFVRAPSPLTHTDLDSPPVAPRPKYRDLPAPHPQHPRARQLTPIRRGGGLFRAPVALASPSTTTDLDISDLDFDFSTLSLITPSARLHLRQPPTPEYLLPLLDECAQTSPHEFSAFIETFPFDPIVQPVDSDLTSPIDVEFRKIGEASYSEVFGIGNVVLKVIPLRDDTSASAPTPISEPETPIPSEAKDVLKEIIVTRAMGETCDGFVKLLRTYIVRGRYPEKLLALWDEYDRKKGSEGVRPGMFCFCCHAVPPRETIVRLTG